MVTNKYGHEHRRLRAAGLPFAYGTPCVRCGRTLVEGQPIDLDHDDTGARTYLGFACAACNRRAGAIKGNKARRRSISMDEVRLGVDIARDRSRTSVVAVGWASHPRDGRVIAAHLTLLDGVTDADVVFDMYAAQKARSVAVNGSGSMRVLSEPLKALGAQVIEASAQDVADANGRLLDSLRARLVRIPKPHPELTAAVQWAAGRSLTDGTAVDKRRSERDAAPLVALELAVWVLLRESAHPMPAIY